MHCVKKTSNNDKGTCDGQNDEDLIQGQELVG